MTQKKLLPILVIFFTVLYLKSRKEPTPEGAVEGWGRDSSRDVVDYVNSKTMPAPRHFCRVNSRILVMVHSKPQNFQARQAIRQTWQQETKTLFFLLGRTKDRLLQDSIDRETHEHLDIVQGGFTDSYNNLSLKSFAMLHLAVRCGNRSKYLLKTDDDTLINIDRIKEELLKHHRTQLLVGYLLCSDTPNRDPSKTRYVSSEMYPDESYPPYLSGGAYLMSMEVAKMLHQAARRTPLLHIEDVYVTGVCARKAGVKPRHNDLFSKKYILKRGCGLVRSCAVFNVGLQEMRQYYHRLKNYWFLGCKDQFSSFRWLLSNVLAPKSNPFSYRQTCN